MAEDDGRRWIPTEHPLLREMDKQAEPARRELVNRGLLVTEAEMCAHLGLEPAALHQKVEKSCLFTLCIGESLFYPAFYGNPKLPREGIERVSKVLGDLPDWAKWMFFMRKNLNLDGHSPLELLEQGDIEEVERAAYSYRNG